MKTTTPKTKLNPAAISALEERLNLIFKYHFNPLWIHNPVEARKLRPAALGPETPELAASNDRIIATWKAKQSPKK